MNSKRVFSLFILSLLVVSILVTFVSATPQETTNWINDKIEYVSAIATPLFGPLFGNTQLLTRVFFALLLFLIIEPLTEQLFGGKPVVSKLVAFVITALALIALPSGFLDAILVQYGALGAALLAIIPFVILAVFTVRMKSLMLARMTWIFYIVYYVALFIYKIASLSPPLRALSKEAIPYWAAIIAGILILVFIKPFRKLVFKGELDAKEEEAIKGIKFRSLGRKALNEETKSIVDAGDIK